MTGAVAGAFGIDALRHVTRPPQLALASLLPFLVPLALFGVETVRGRRRWMLALLSLGAVTSALLLADIIRRPASATIDGAHIAYVSGGPNALLLGTSLWCAWAAITSVVVVVYLRRTASSSRAGAVEAGAGQRR